MFVRKEDLSLDVIKQYKVECPREMDKEVVLKVLKPGVSDVLNADLSFLYIASRVLEFRNDPDCFQVFAAKRRRGRRERRGRRW